MSWLQGTGAIGSEIPFSVGCDRFGNVYYSGLFQGTVDFDQSQATYNLTAPAFKSIFIKKLDRNGNFIWAKKIGGIQESINCYIKVDRDGNIFATGEFYGSIDVDPGENPSDTFYLNSIGRDIFIIKLNPNGELLWAKKFGGGDTKVNAINIDTNGNIYTTGKTRLKVDFDPGESPGDTFYIEPVAPSNSAFVLKLNSTGGFIWAKEIKSTGSAIIGEDITVDKDNNVYTTGICNGTTDLDPGIGVYNISSGIYITKFDINGNFVWDKSYFSVIPSSGRSVVVDSFNNVYVAGYFRGTVNFGTGVINTGGNPYTFIVKLNSSGNQMWLSHFPGGSNEAMGLTIDKEGSVYTTGNFAGTVDFDPSTNAADTFYLRSPYETFMFVSKLNTNGNFQWAIKNNGKSCYGRSLVTNDYSDIFITGFFSEYISFDETVQDTLISNGNYDHFILKLTQKGVMGSFYLDLNSNCISESNEVRLPNRKALIQPGNIITQTNSSGFWQIDSLPNGNYTITIDTSDGWISTCSTTQSFTVTNPDSLINVSSFGLKSTNPCPASDVMIHAPLLRPGFSYQKVYIQICNKPTGSDYYDSAYVIVELDSLLSVQSASVSYTDLGNNKFRIAFDTIYPGECKSFWFNCILNANAFIGQTLCMEAKLYPIENCMLDTISNSTPQGITPCFTAYDSSHIELKKYCLIDSIYFIINNTGTGNMSCYSQIRLFIDAQLTLIDSIKLNGGDSDTLVFSGDGRTWRLEVDQHPLHPGNSKPNTTIERCGNVANWTPNLVNLLPPDDADPFIDIYCGIVTGSFDPNDKTGFPLGIDSAHHYINQNQDIEYLIRFQNTGTDTAFNVVIKDILPIDLDIFSVIPGASSHNYSFEMYGPRVLEWTFQNILLPDSATNQAASNGFVKFKVKQNKDLPLGTIIENSASIYFDYNAPVITNTYHHTVGVPQTLNFDG